MPGRPPSAASGPRAAAWPGVLVGLLVALLVLAGCAGGGAEPDDDAAAPEPGPVGAAATTTRGAELRAALTWLGTERVHLVLAHSRALRAAGGQPDEAPVVAARSALEDSAETTVDTLGRYYSDARAELLPALRAHDTSLLARASALVTGDDTAPAGADELDARQGELAAAVRRVVPRLRTQDVESALAAGTAATLEAVQAVADDSLRAPALQRGADEAAWATARLLAVGVSSDRGLGLAGSPATELRGRLTGLLAEHVLLSGELAARLAAAGGELDDPHVQATEDALDAAAVSLAELAGRAAPETALPVLTAWRDHLRQVRELAAARAARRPAPAPPPPYLDRLQAALAPHADALPPRAAEVGARGASSLRRAVEDAAKDARTAPDSVRTAASDTVAPAALVAAALAERLQLS